MSASNPSIKILTGLTVVLAAALALVSVFGAFVPTTYERDAASMAAQGMGQDWVDLFLVVPLLILSLTFMLRGSRIASYLYGGTVYYIMYSFFIYAFGVHFNTLFLLYCLILGLSLYAFVLFMCEMSRQDIQSWYDEKVPTRSTGIFMLLIAALFYLLWLKDIVPAIVSNSVPASVSDYGLLVNPVHVLDLAIALPGLIIAALWLMKKHRLGYILTPIFLVFIIILAVALIGMVVMLEYRGLSDDISVAVIFAVLAVVSALFLFVFLKHMRPITMKSG
jgi:hypothetical protein